MLKIYHHPKCSKSRAGLRYLQEKGAHHEVVEYFKNPLAEKEMERLMVKLNLKPSEMVRTQEAYFKKNLKGMRFNDHEWIRILCEHPSLLRRPVVEGMYRAVVGDPVENIDTIIHKTSIP